jgi:hypothetical protein
MEETQKIVIKSESRLNTNLFLLTIAVTLFTFIIAINPALVKSNIFLSLQLTLSIPLFCSSIFARAKLAYTSRIKMWNDYGFITFIIAYSFMINSIGILLSSLVSVFVGIIFFVVNIMSPLFYSFFEIRENRNKLKSRICKDLFFIAILIIMGILPILGVY